MVPPVTAAGGAARASAAGVDPLQASGLLEQVFAAGRRTAASELEGILPGSAEKNPDQQGVSVLPDRLAAAGRQLLGWLWPAQRCPCSLQGPVPAREVGPEAVDAAATAGPAGDHLNTEITSDLHVTDRVWR